MTTVIKKMKTVVSVSKGTKKAMNTSKKSITANIFPREIYEFVKERRAGRKQKVGVLVGLKQSNGIVGIGWSRANVKKDAFNKWTGLKIARGRALASVPEAFPSSLSKSAMKFIKRCERFFKVTDKEIWYNTRRENVV